MPSELTIDAVENLPAEDLSRSLLDWYDRHARALPWRAPPGERSDPYRVWLSEIMLQQTTVAAVKPYFEDFCRRWPSVGDLARAPLDDVLSAWAGLGYYARARNMHKCAQQVEEEFGGVFPDTEDALRALPGIGPYTAAAIAAIAFGRRATVVDGNVERVITRLFALETPLPDVKPDIRLLAERLTPQGRPGDYAQAVMDLGATICAPRKAACTICPWMENCRGRRLGIAETLPRKRPRAVRPTRYGTAFAVIREDGCVLLRSRPAKGLLGGMSEVPSTPWTEEAPSDVALNDHQPVAASWREVPAPVRHTFTHFHLELNVRVARVPADAPLLDAADPDRCRWVPRSDLDGSALPSVMRKVLTAALESF